MRKIFLSLLMALPVLFMFTGCEKTSDLPKGSMTLKVDGKTYTSTVATGTYLALGGGSAATITGNFLAGITSSTVTLTLTSSSGGGTKTYNVDSNNDNVGAYTSGINLYATHWDSNLHGGGSMTITSIDETLKEIKGTYKLTVANKDNTTSTKEIEGDFYVTYF